MTSTPTPSPDSGSPFSIEIGPASRVIPSPINLDYKKIYNCSYTSESKTKKFSYLNSDFLNCKKNIKLENPFENPIKVCIIGAGIAGLTIAYELMLSSQKSGRPIDIDIIEKNNFAGGKIVGFRREDDNGNQSPLEHSTRVYPIGYTALLGMMKNIPSYRNKSRENNLTVLDDLVGMRFGMTSIETFKKYFVSEPGVKIYPATKSLVNLLITAKVKKAEINFLISKLQNYFKSDMAKRISLTAGLSIGQFLSYDKLSVRAQTIISSLFGLIVAARVYCDAFVIMQMVEGLGYFGSPKCARWAKEYIRADGSKLAGGNCFNGPSSELFINPLINHINNLKGKNKFQLFFNTHVFKDLPTKKSFFSVFSGEFTEWIDNSKIPKPNEKNPRAILLDELLPDPASDTNSGKKYNALFVCTPHMVASEFFPKNIPRNVLQNQWSFGIQMYCTDLQQIKSSYLESSSYNMRTYYEMVGSPWQIIIAFQFSKQGVIEAKKMNPDFIPFWGSFDFGTVNGKPILCCLTTVISNQHYPGIFVGKTCLNCTPEEMCQEILIQSGIREPATIESILNNNPTFGSVKYVNLSKEQIEELPKEWLKGPLQSNGYRWISDYTLYIKTAYNLSIGSHGVCSLENYDDNPRCLDPNLLPLRVNTAKEFSSLQYGGVVLENIENKGKLLPQFFPIREDPVYFAGEYVESTAATVPTMEKACESAKVAAQKFIQDFGIKSKKRLKKFSEGTLKISTDAVNKHFIPASTLVQVMGIDNYDEDIVDFMIPTLWEKIQIFFYLSTKLHYPPLYPYFILFIFICVILMALLIFFIVRIILHYRKVKSREVVKAEKL